MHLQLYVLYSLLALLLGAVPVYSSSQFCEVNPIESHDFCIALNTFHNSSSAADDFYFTMSAKFPQGSGWLAVGSGYIMHRSLMFVMYPGTKHGSVVVGQRTTSYHDPPKFADDMPQFRLISTKFDGGYSTANFVCYACNKWDGNRMDTNAETQPWVWASNDFQEPNSDDSDKKLSRHNYYDDFYIDMKAAHVSGSGETYFPTIEERHSIAAGEFKNDSPKASGSGSRSNPYLLHGIFVGIGFGLLYPLGVFALVAPRLASVQNHWIIQTATSFFVLGGIILGLSNTLQRGGIEALFGLHQLLGCLVGLFLLAQLALGLWNHIQYLESQIKSVQPVSSSWMKTCHMWLGRSLYIIGCFNVVFGLRAARRSSPRLFLWVVIVGMALLVYTMLLRAKRRATRLSKVEHSYDQVNTSEEDL